MRRRLLAILVGCALLITGSTASGADLAQIYGCAADSGGALRIVPAGTRCKSTETKLVWNVQGPRGPRGNEGERGPRGLIGPEGDRGPRGYPGIAVSQSCAAGSYVSGITSAGTLACTPLEQPTDDPSEPPPVDSDLDGSPDTEDCDPQNPTIYPGAPEVGNGIDDDCDNEIDETVVLDLAAMSLSRDAVRAGTEVPGTVTLTKPAPDDVVVTLQSNDGSVAAPFPEQVTVAQGATYAPFWLQTYTPGSVTIEASLGGTTRTDDLTVHPPDRDSAVTSVSVASPVALGSTISGTVTLDLQAPPGGAEVSLTSSDPSVLKVPAAVTVIADQTAASFPVELTDTGTATITAAYAGTQAETSVTVTE